jgi:outer membrane immunogenic protein
MMKKYICAAIALLAAPAAQAQNFNGASIGVQVGMEQGKVDSVAILSGSGLGTVTSDGSKASGATIGISLAYDAQVFDNFVVGAELAGNYSTKSNSQQLLVSSAPTTPITADYDPRMTYEVTARMGVLATPNLLLYARGGYVNSKLKATISTPGGAPINVAGNNNGWLVGAGAEYALSDKFSTRLEVRHMDFQGPVSRNQVQLGFGYHF